MRFLNDGIEIEYSNKTIYAGYLVPFFSSFDAGQYGVRILKIENYGCLRHPIIQKAATAPIDMEQHLNGNPPVIYTDTCPVHAHLTNKYAHTHILLAVMNTLPVPVFGVHFSYNI